MITIPVLNPHFWKCLYQVKTFFFNLKKKKVLTEWLDMEIGLHVYIFNDSDRKFYFLHIVLLQVCFVTLRSLENSVKHYQYCIHTWIHYHNTNIVIHEYVNKSYTNDHLSFLGSLSWCQGYGRGCTSSSGIPLIKRKLPGSLNTVPSQPGSLNQYCVDSWITKHCIDCLDHYALYWLSGWLNSVLTVRFY